jgi:hypothetical protein
MRHLFPLIMIIACTCTSTYAQVAKIAAERAKEESQKQAYQNKYRTVDFSKYLRAVIDRSYVPQQATKFVYFLNSKNPKYIKVIEKYVARQGLVMVNYDNLGLSGITDQQVISNRLTELGIKGSIEFVVKKNVTELPSSAFGWSGGMSFGSGAFTSIGVTVSFIDEDFSDTPYLVLSGIGYSSIPSKAPRLVSGQVNALIGKSIKQGFIIP